MASFVESATLKVVDQSTAQINKINAALKKLHATAKSLKSTTINIRVNDRGLNKAAADARQLAAALRSLRGAAGGIRIGVNTAGISRARTQINQLHTAARRPINVNVQQRAGRPVQPPAVRPAARPPIAPRVQPGFARQAGTAVGRGITRGFGVAGVVTENLGLLAAAAYGAATALRALGAAAEARQRQEARTKALSSPEQQAAARKYEAEHGPYYKGAAQPMGETAYRKFVNDIRPDVGGGTPERVEENAQTVARYFQNKVLPEVILRTGQSPEEAMKGLEQLVKTINNATQDLIDDQGKLTPDFERVAEGIRLAQGAGSEIKPGLIKTAMAGAKTAGFTLSPEAIAILISQAADKGRTVGNETFQLIKSLGGTMDNKKLNESLFKAGFITNVRRNKQGNIEAGSGTQLDPGLRMTNPGAWLQKYLKPLIERETEGKGSLAARRAEAARKAGKTAEEVTKAGEATAPEIVNALEKRFPTMRGTAANQLAQLMLGWQQSMKTMEQARIANQQNAPEIIAGDWVQQWDKLKTAVADASTTAGVSAANYVNLAQIFSTMSETIRKAQEGNPEAQAQVLGAGVGVAGAIALLAKAMWAPVAGLTTAGAELTGAAGALTAAAARLGVAGAAGAAGTAAGTAGGAAAGAAGAAKLGIFGTAALTLGSAAALLLASTKEAGGVSNLPELERHQAAQDALAKSSNDLRVAMEDRTALEGKTDPASVAKRAELDTSIAQLNQTVTRATANMAQVIQEQKGLAAGVDPDKAPMPKPATKGLVLPEDVGKPIITDRVEVKPTGALKMPPLIQPGDKPILVEPVPSAAKQGADVVKPEVAKPIEVKPSPEWKPILVPPAEKPVNIPLDKPIEVKPTSDWKPVPVSEAPARPFGTMGDFDFTQFTAGASMIAGAPSQFQAAFSSGAQQIGATGPTIGQGAASAIQGQAGACGAAIGQAAGAAIQAACSNLNISVNANVTNVGGGADKGSQKAAQ
jgi:hypothetical protein